jgi:Domain of unknown function (DUF1707)
MSNVVPMPVELRIGDRERAAAADRLSAHHAAGRLSVEELERRLERADAAVFQHDLDALEADLPALDVPSGNPSARWRAGSRRGRPRPVLPDAWRGRPPVPLALPVALIALGLAASFAVGHPIAPLFIVAAFLLWRRAAWS